MGEAREPPLSHLRASRPLREAPQLQRAPWGNPSPYGPVCAWCRVGLPSGDNTVTGAAYGFDPREPVGDELS
jgi:hypothetical protein